MRELAAQLRTTEMTLDEVWQRVVGVEHFPTRMAYVKGIKQTATGESGHYADITTVMWLPLAIDHYTVEYKPRELLKYRVPLPLGGKMTQTGYFREENGTVDLRLVFEFDLGNAVFNSTVGPVLERRLFNMMKSLFPDIQRVR